MKNLILTSSRFIIRLTTIGAILTTLGCGGGGGGGGASGAAFVRVNANPRVIDSGDRTNITVEVSDIHESGILLKIRFPSKLAYVPSSAVIDSGDEDEFDATPMNYATSGNNSYLVFFLTKDDFGSREEGNIIIELVGNESIADGKIEVDADVNDEAIPDASEFNVEAPEFAAEDEIAIFVED